MTEPVCARVHSQRWIESGITEARKRGDEKIIGESEREGSDLLISLRSFIVQAGYIWKVFIDSSYKAELKLKEQPHDSVSPSQHLYYYIT